MSGDPPLMPAAEGDLRQAGIWLKDEVDTVTEWRSKAMPRYPRLTKKAEALIAAVYLAGITTRRLKRALFGLLGVPSARTWSAGPGER